MASHICKTYLNSCLKVPIDPCNNCPAPFFNRPQLYLGRLSATPNTCNTVVKKHCHETDTENKWSSSCRGIRSLAKLYDSIPDYTDLNHLSGEEFYTTLNSLRSTCRELEIKTSCQRPADQGSTTSSSLTSALTKGERSKKKDKCKKKKGRTLLTCQVSQQTAVSQQISHKENQAIIDHVPEPKVCNSSFSKSSKHDLDNEVEILKKSIDDFEAEFKRPSTSCSSKECVNKDSKYKKQSMEKVPIRSTFTSSLRERLRKSLSFNDLQSLAAPPELEELRKENKMLEFLSLKGGSNLFKDNKKLSNYFKENTKLEGTEIPKIIVDSPETGSSFSDQKSKKKFNKNEECNTPFKIFDLETTTRRRSFKHSTPSPIHPVARPNLAATLRAESSKKKVQELKTNCTFHDTTAQFDWEVRKTPAWKTLSLHETHKQILQIRLATRKAEQALQQREYELNMELMRQRVKSAPLLLEGPTYWGPHVGKLTHSCQKDGRRHLCERTKRKNNSSRGHSCRRRLFSTTSTIENYNSDNPANTFRIEGNSGAEMKQKMNELRKIYGSITNIAKSQSRTSNRSTNTQTSLKSQRKHKSKKNLHKKGNKTEPNFEAVEIDSADELSSLDRALL